MLDSQSNDIGSNPIGGTNFFHVHDGCLDEDDKCHAFCFKTEIVWTDGSHPSKPLVFCPNEDKHPGTMLDLREGN